MYSLQQFPRKVKMPFLLVILVSLLKVFFPGWSLQASPKPHAARRQYSPRTMEQALNLSLLHGYNSVNWSAVC